MRYTKSGGCEAKMGTKGPKVRFPPGTFVEMADDLGAVFEVVQLYRLKSAPSEWVYRLLRISCQSHEQDWEPHKDLHKIWWTPLSCIPLLGSVGVDWTRSMSNRDMVRLATVRMDDLFES